MNCQEIQTLLNAYLDRECTPSERRFVDIHLARCDHCQQELAWRSSLQHQLRHTLTSAARTAPSPQAWNHLQAKLKHAQVENSPPQSRFLGRRLPQPIAPWRWVKEARPLPYPLQSWLKRFASNVGLNLNSTNLRGVQMKKRFAYAAIAALLILTLAILLRPETVRPVSAQEILDRSAEVQAMPPANQGILHTKSEGFFNVTALFPPEPGLDTIAVTPARTIFEDYTDLETGQHRSLIRDADTGQIVNVFGQDETHLYVGGQTVTTATLTVYRSPLPENLQSFWTTAAKRDSFDLDSQKFFEQAQQMPNVEYIGQEMWFDGRLVHVLRFTPEVEPIIQGLDISLSVVGTISLSTPDAEGEEIPSGSIAPLSAIKEFPPLVSTMYFDEETYELLETRETIEREGQEVVIGYHRQLVNELLSADTAVAWDFSDLPELTVIDDPTGEHTPFFAFLPEALSLEAFLTQADFTPYLLPTMPEGFTLEITALDGFAEVVIIGQEEAQSAPQDTATVYTIAYHNETGDFVELTGPITGTIMPRSETGTEIYEATNGLKFWVMPNSGVYSGLPIGGVFIGKAAPVGQVISETVTTADEAESHTVIQAQGHVIAHATPLDDNLIFGQVETPDGLQFQLTSNLSLDEIKVFVENMRPAR